MEKGPVLNGTVLSLQGTIVSRHYLLSGKVQVSDLLVGELVLRIDHHSNLKEILGRTPA